jgi:hypothetical protein
VCTGSMCVCAHHVGTCVCTVRLQWPRGKLQLCHMCSAPHKRSMRLNGSLLFRSVGRSTTNLPAQDEQTQCNYAKQAKQAECGPPGTASRLAGKGSALCWAAHAGNGHCS